MVLAFPKAAAKKSGIRSRNETDSAKKLAQKAVDDYQEMLGNLRDAEKEFRDNHPEAADDLERIGEYRDQVQEHIDRTKLLVRAAGVSIGDFKVTKKKTQPGYLPEEIVGVIAEMTEGAVKELEDREDAMGMDSTKTLVLALSELFESGVVKAISFDKDAAKIFFPNAADMAQLFQPAWDEGGKELTPAVKVPTL